MSLSQHPLLTLPPHAIRQVNSYLLLRDVVGVLLSASKGFNSRWQDRGSGLGRLNFHPTAEFPVVNWAKYTSGVSELYIGGKHGIPTSEFARLLSNCAQSLTCIHLSSTRPLERPLNMRDLYAQLIALREDNDTAATAAQHRRASLFPNLTTFVASNMFVNEMFYFFRACKLTTLRVLKVHRNNDLGASELCSIDSNCVQHLVELSIDACPIHAESVVRMLEILKQGGKNLLEFKEASSSNGSNECNGEVTPPSKRPTLLPLRCLSLSVGGHGASGSHLHGSTVLNWLSENVECLQLRKLALEQCDLDFETVGKYARNSGEILTVLSIGGRHTNDDVVEALCTNANHLPVLSSLSLKQSATLTNQGLFALSSLGAQLRALDISWCNLLTDVCIEQITTTLPLLQELMVGHCKKISDRGITKLLSTEKKKKKKGPGKNHLFLLDARHCPSIFVTDRKFVKMVDYARNSLGIDLQLEGSGRM